MKDQKVELKSEYIQSDWHPARQTIAFPQFVFFMFPCGMYANSPLWILCTSDSNGNQIIYIFLVVLQQNVDFQFV